MSDKLIFISTVMVYLKCSLIVLLGIAEVYCFYRLNKALLNSEKVKGVVSTVSEKKYKGIGTIYEEKIVLMDGRRFYGPSFKQRGTKDKGVFYIKTMKNKGEMGYSQSYVAVYLYFAIMFLILTTTVVLFL